MTLLIMVYIQYYRFNIFQQNFFERVEVLKGASSFLNGAMPSNGGIGGAINLLPKRAGNEPLNRVTVVPILMVAISQMIFHDVLVKISNLGYE